MSDEIYIFQCSVVRKNMEYQLWGWKYYLLDKLNHIILKRVGKMTVSNKVGCLNHNNGLCGKFITLVSVINVFIFEVET